MKRIFTLLTVFIMIMAVSVGLAENTSPPTISPGISQIIVPHAAVIAPAMSINLSVAAIYSFREESYSVENLAQYAISRDEAIITSNEIVLTEAASYHLDIFTVPENRLPSFLKSFLKSARLILISYSCI